MLLNFFGGTEEKGGGTLLASTEKDRDKSRVVAAAGSEGGRGVGLILPEWEAGERLRRRGRTGRQA